MARIERTYWVEERKAGKRVLRQVSREEGVLIGSRLVGGSHGPLFDLDFRVTRGSEGVTFHRRVRADRWLFLTRLLEQYGLVAPVHLSSSQTLWFHVPVQIRRSSTAGHFHLYIERGVSWRVYRELLRAMHRAGLIEKKYLQLCEKHCMGMLIKPPLTKKHPKARALQGSNGSDALLYY